jgi:hypothetical protein
LAGLLAVLAIPFIVRREASAALYLLLLAVSVALPGIGQISELRGHDRASGSTVVSHVVAYLLAGALLILMVIFLPPRRIDVTASAILVACYDVIRGIVLIRFTIRAQRTGSG